ncbi:GTP pyrophosphokinase family protein [Alloscardovia omnicolens]|uniref:GTP pyrophosphokinase n=1 Tax=Alloscardovia omnicolens TaxID=419015 RepID=UPI003A76186E
MTDLAQAKAVPSPSIHSPSVSGSSMYGMYRPAMDRVLSYVVTRLEAANERTRNATGYSLYEHINVRIKADDSMREKCERKGYSPTEHSALKEVRDAIGIRVVTGFIDDIQLVVDELRSMDGISIVEEKDYVFNAKPNGYRSYHVIASVNDPDGTVPDCEGQIPGSYYVEVQIRTIAMDSWAALEHELKYKKGIKNQERIVAELKRCADELASCDMSMQTIRHLMNAKDNGAD